MYLFDRNPYRYNKKYSYRHSISRSIENIVVQRLEQQKLYCIKNKLNEMKQNNHYRKKDDNDYSAFGLTKKRRQVSQGNCLSPQLPEIANNMNSSKQNLVESCRVKENKRMRNQIKLQPIKVNNLQRTYYPEYLQSPAEFNEQMKPRFAL